MSVKQKGRGRPAGKANGLSSDLILERALALLNEDGKVPSIRRLATALQVDPMAIYHYFANKGALLEALIRSQVESICQPTGHLTWQGQLDELAMSYLGLLQANAGLLETMLSMDSTGPAQVFSQRYGKIVAPLQLDPSIEKSSLDLLADYLHGFALAIRANPEGPTLEMAEAPLEFFIRALEREQV